LVASVLESVRPENAHVFRELTFPRYRSLLDEPSSSGGVVGAGHRADGQPAGLALARLLGGEEAELLSWFVSREFRGRGLGAALLAHLEWQLRERGCRRCRAVYTTGTPSTPIVEHLLRKARWTPPEQRLVIFRFDHRVLAAPWLRRARIGPPYEVLPWSEVREQDLQGLRSRDRSPTSVPEYLLPFGLEQDGQPDVMISVAVRLDGALVAWLIAHSIAPDTVRYSRLFVDTRGGGSRMLAMGLIAEAIRRQVRGMGPSSYVVCGVRSENHAVVRLARRMGPESVRESRIAFRAIGGPPA